jgi:cell division protein FtsN
MTKDYKHRTSRRTYRQNSGVSIWRWLLAAALVGLFGIFLMVLRSSDTEEPSQSTAKTLALPAPNKEPKKAPAPKPEPSKPDPETPRFEFYTLLPELEVEIPESEIKILKSEEKRGLAKPGNYVLQVGSFRKYEDADRLKAELAMLGIQSTIENAKLDEVSWNRVKIGPYSSMTAVDEVRKELRKQHIDAIVMSAK